MDLANDLKEKVVIITGSSRGIGKACAIAFSRLGAKVGLHYHRDKTAALNTQKVLPGDSDIFQADLSVEAGCKKLISEAGTIFNGIDILIVNHGIWERADIDNITAQDVDRTIDLNLKSLFYLTRETVPLFPSTGGGAIVFVSSTAGQRGEAHYAHYAASKGGVNALTKSLAVELAAKGIRVNAVAPGWVLTDMTKQVLTGAFLERQLASIPLGKIALPEDIAPSVVFLASSFANHITGEILNVNGGSVLCG